MSLGWITFCERQDAKQAKHGRGLNSMMPNGKITDGGINILLFPDHSKLSDQVSTILISVLSLTVYDNHEIRSQNNQSTRTFSSIFESLTFDLKSRSTTRNHDNTSG